MVVKSPHALQEAMQAGSSSQAQPKLSCPGAGHVNHDQDMVKDADMMLPASSSPAG